MVLALNDFSMHINIFLDSRILSFICDVSWLHFGDDCRVSWLHFGDDCRVYWLHYDSHLEIHPQDPYSQNHQQDPRHLEICHTPIEQLPRHLEIQDNPIEQLPRHLEIQDNPIEQLEICHTSLEQLPRHLEIQDLPRHLEICTLEQDPRKRLNNPKTLG